MRCKNASGLVASRRNLITGAGISLIAMSAPAATPGGSSGSWNDVAFGPGLHRIDADRTISGTLALQPGARIEIAAGARLRLLGDLIAPTMEIFLGAGEVELDQSRLLAARPEWWGAIPDNAEIDCASAIEAALRAHPAVQLGLGDYYLGRTLRVGLPNRRLWGIGRTNGARGSRLVGQTTEGPVVLVGTDTAPLAINDYLRGIDMRWIEIARISAARPSEVDDPSAPTGLAIRSVLDCIFEGVRASEHAVGFSIRGAVRTYLNDCTAFRSAFAAGAKDMFVGFDLDGRVTPITTGANASLYLTDCNARTGNSPHLSVSVGCRLLGAFSDTFLLRFETTELSHGILVDGLAASLPIAQRRVAHLNLHIDTPVLDQCRETCLAFHNLSDWAMVDVNAPWLALSRGGEAALRLQNCRGALSVVAGQIVGSGESAATGVHARRSSGFGLAGTKLMGFSHPIDAEDCSGLDLVAAIIADSDMAEAVALRGCKDSYIRVRVLGGDDRGVDIRLDSNSQNIAVEHTGLRAPEGRCLPKP